MEHISFWSVDPLGDNVHTIERNTETLTDASKEVDLEVYTQKTKHILRYRHQNARLIRHKDS
jgi:hypothetical protein